MKSCRRTDNIEFLKRKKKIALQNITRYDKEIFKLRKEVEEIDKDIEYERNK